VAATLARRTPTGLDLIPRAGGLRYSQPDEELEFRGLAAVAKALNHTNFAFALVGAAMLLLILPLTAALQWASSPFASVRGIRGA
jgi:hypothetical protein